MISCSKTKHQIILLLGLCLILMTSCKKDELILPKPNMITKWQKITGHYKVYDTLGVFMYEMDIYHSDTLLENKYKVDSLTFINFDGQFSFSTVQSSITVSNYPNMLQLGMHYPLLDTNNKRFRIFGYGPQNGYNNIKNDTIIFYFEKQNILYYLHDLVPYYYCNCKHVAVKQH